MDTVSLRKHKRGEPVGEEENTICRFIDKLRRVSLPLELLYFDVILELSR